MRAAISLAVLLALAACSDATQPAEPDNAAITDVEALPPDETVDPPPEEMANEAVSNDGVAPQE